MGANVDRHGGRTNTNYRFVRLNPLNTQNTLNLLNTIAAGSLTLIFKLNLQNTSSLFAPNMVLVNKTLYASLHDKITKMTKQELQRREGEIYESDLSFISSDRTQIYMELGIITQLLYKFQKN
tara:strand:+ start:2011 stop:2379 length:369 start_codon:yes stop_codon:yes gene_type:complete